MSDLTAEQSVRLAVFQRLMTFDPKLDEALVKQIHLVSDAIINGERVVTVAADDGSVTYQGETYINVPAWATYIAADSSGYVCFFENEPVLRYQTWYANGTGRCEDVGSQGGEVRYLPCQSQAYPALKLDSRK
jgi:hypothetical protein